MMSNVSGQMFYRGDKKWLLLEWKDNLFLIWSLKTFPMFEIKLVDINVKNVIKHVLSKVLDT